MRPEAIIKAPRVRVTRAPKKLSPNIPKAIKQMNRPANSRPIL